MLAPRRFLLARLAWAVVKKPPVLAFWALGLVPAAVLLGPSLLHASTLAWPFEALALLALAVLFGLALFLATSFALLAWRLVQLLRSLARYGRERQSPRAAPVDEPAWRAPPPPTPESLARKEAYAELGLDYDASLPEVKAAYRRLARQLHPDVSKAPDAGERFQRVQAAYDLLTTC